jgi:hypothetical protein
LSFSFSSSLAWFWCSSSNRDDTPRHRHRRHHRYLSGFRCPDGLHRLIAVDHIYYSRNIILFGTLTPTPTQNVRCVGRSINQNDDRWKYVCG